MQLFLLFVPCLKGDVTKVSKIWYLSPSNQSSNVGINGYGTEKDQMIRLVDEITPHLDRAGVSFVVGSPDSSLAERVTESNGMGAGFHLCFHSNAGGGGKAWGPVALYYSEDGRIFGRKLVNALLALGQMNNRSENLTQRKDLYELRKTKAPACLLEVDFHDSHVGVTFLTQQRKEIAAAIAGVIIEADGKSFVPVTAGECIDQCLKWGIFAPGTDWNSNMTKSDAAVLAARLMEALQQGVRK